MNIQIQETSPTRRTVTVTVPAAEAAEGRREVARQFARQAKLPGFRPGKAPEAMVARRFAKEIESESRQRLIGEGYERLKAEGKLSLGMDDFLMGLAGERETAIYLLKQRSEDHG